MKVSTWDQKLNAYIESKRHEPFAWATNDCVAFVQGAAEAQLGTNPFDGRIPSYTDYKTAVRQYSYVKNSNSAWYDLLNDVFTRHHGLLPPRGSIVAKEVSNPAVRALGVGLGVVLDTRAAFVGDDGLVFVKVSKDDPAWLVE